MKEGLMKRLLVLALVFSACASTAPTSDVQPGDAEAAIRGNNAAFQAAMGAGDAEKLASMYVDSAVVYPPNAPAMNGPAAIRQFWAGMTGANNINLKLTPVNVMQSCDMAVETGTYEIAVAPKSGGGSMNDNGKYVVVWRKVGEQWKIAVDTFNSNMPAGQ
jgi:ketosteroid isomerase-like protein